MNDEAQSAVADADRGHQERIALKFINQVFEGKYEVTNLIGMGGMSYVLEAHDPSLNRKVAIKVLMKDFLSRKDMVKRFIHEARTIAHLPDKKNVVEIFSIGKFKFEDEEREWPYYVMQFLPGEDLEQRMDDRFENEQSFSPEECYSYLAQVLDGLQAAHDVGVIHRDLKPGNIKIMRMERESRVKIVDFGISRMLNDEGKSTSGLTRAGQFFGTPAIMSPEQIQANHDMICPATDLYSVGCVAFCLLTGRYPFEDSAPMNVAIKHLNEMPPAPSQFREGLTAELDMVVLKALEKNPEDRWQNASELKAAFKRVLTGKDNTTAHSIIPSQRFDDSGDRPALGEGDRTAVSQEIDPGVIDASPPAPVNPIETGPTALAPSQVPEARKPGLSVAMLVVIGLLLIVFVGGVLVLASRCNKSDDERVAKTGKIVDKPWKDEEKPPVVIPHVPDAIEDTAGKSVPPYVPSTDPIVTKAKAVPYHKLKSYDQKSWDLLMSSKLIRPKASGKKMVNCKKATLTLATILKHEPNFPDANFYQAECFRRAGNSRKAKKYYQHFLDLAPNHYLASKAKRHVD